MSLKCVNFSKNNVFGLKASLYSESYILALGDLCLPYQNISYIALKTCTRACAAKLLEPLLELEVNVGQGPSLDCQSGARGG